MEAKVYNFDHKRIEKLQYWYHEPENIVAGEKYPLILFLHGAGERGEDLTMLWKAGVTKMLHNGYSPDAFVIAPQCPAGWMWNLLTVELKELVDFTVDSLPIDPDRVVVTGLSMGGFGTWEMGMSFPGYFAALAPVCGGGVCWRVPLIGKTPVLAVHGDADPLVPPINSIMLCEKLKSVGGNVQLALLHGVEHNSWDFAYGQMNVIDWLLSQNRKNNQ